jgi:ABC-type transport system substrate-binding protein
MKRVAASLAVMLAGCALAAAAWGRAHGDAQLYVRSTAIAWGLWFNAGSPTFHDNPDLVRAVGFALDRPALIRTVGPFAGSPAALLVPPGVPGHGSRSPYPLDGPDLEKAQALASGALRDRTPTLAVPPGLRGLGDEVKRELAAIGLDVQVLPLAGVSCERCPPPRIDFWLSGWRPDYPDPAAAFPTDLSSPWKEQFARAERAAGSARSKAFARLDYDLMMTAPPIMPFMVANARFLVSARVHCLHWNPWYGVDYAAVCLS